MARKMATIWLGDDGELVTSEPYIPALHEMLDQGKDDIEGLVRFFLTIRAGDKMYKMRAYYNADAVAAAQKEMGVIMHDLLHHLTKSMFDRYDPPQEQPHGQS